MRIVNLRLYLVTGIQKLCLSSAKADSKPYQTSKLFFFVCVKNGLKQLILFWQGSEYTSITRLRAFGSILLQEAWDEITHNTKWIIDTVTRSVSNNICQYALVYCTVYHIRFLCNKSLLVTTSITHFSPVSHFYTPWKRQKTFGLAFSGGIEMWHWTKMG